MRIAAFILCCCVMAYGLFRPEPPPDLFDGSDKMFHLIAFGGLALITRIAFPAAPGWFLWGLLYAQAPLLEYLQHALRWSRAFSYGDILANVCGVTLALIAWGLLGLCRRWFWRYE